VLIFATPRSRKFAVIGDALGREQAQAMTVHCRKFEFTEGIVRGVRKAGELLAEHFPR
jgi:uncharacterized membrane protein